MVFKSNIKWVALIGLILSLFSLLLHLLLAKFSNVSLVEYSALAGLQEGLHSKLGAQVNWDQTFVHYFQLCFLIFLLFPLIVDWMRIILQSWLISKLFCSFCYRGIKSYGVLWSPWNLYSLMPTPEVAILVIFYSSLSFVHLQFYSVLF